MNTEMLKALVKLSGNEPDAIDVNGFFEQFPKTQSNLDDLKSLHRLGYISILYGDDTVQEIGVNKKAFDYFKE